MAVGETVCERRAASTRGIQMQDVQSVQEWVQREATVIERLLGEVRKVIVG